MEVEWYGRIRVHNDRSLKQQSEATAKQSRVEHRAAVVVHRIVTSYKALVL